MVDELKVEVHGIRQLRSALKKVDADTTPALKRGFTEIAESVASTARGKMPKRSGRAAGSVKARGKTGGAAIAFGGSAAPYMPWLDFGGSTGKGHIPGVAWSGSITRDWLGKPAGEGRYIYPAIREEGPEIRRKTDDMLERVIKNADFDTRGSG